MSELSNGVPEGTDGLDRRRLLLGFAAAAGLPALPLACLVSPASAATSAAGGSWTLATQIVAGTRIGDPTVLTLMVEALEAEVGAAVVERLRTAVLARDAADIVEPFEDPAIEAAARRFVEMVYTGTFAPGSMPAFHQALAWKVLPFTKAPSVCGPGFGWWTDPPERV